MFDARVLAGPELIILGGCILTLAVRLWLVGTTKRTFRIAPFLTDRGMRVLLDMRFTLFAVGSFLGVQGLTNCLFWFVRNRDVNDPLVALMGSLSAGLGLWAAGALVWSVSRIYRKPRP